jgi:anti-anti-sigma factor
MSLRLEARHCGKVWVLRCHGRIVIGENTVALQKTISGAALEFSRMVINLADVEKVDSSGMGMLMRFLTHARRKGGDLRVAAPARFFKELLQLTLLDSIVKVYESEDDAIASFLQEPALISGILTQPGRVVLFVDQSPDLGAFVRSLLGQNGFEVLSATLLSDARLLLTASRVDFIILIAEASKLPEDSVISSLESRAPGVTVLQLPADFRKKDADEAGRILLDAVGAGPASQA